ncbi:unnamed protein product [Bursaphelenchus xylophilus]|nr:unnamed protein product [Bursaphelenchus xylophilus]CAG9096719.1 unnamed protein product [Bursaphelenchus xylophilus]
MKRLKYEKEHWDDAIYLFRERESKKWNEQNWKVIKRIQEASLPPDAIKLSYIHILDLAKEGHIKPHIDSIRYCGTTISGVSLLSSCVMRLRHKENKELVLDLLLPRRSLYKLSNIGRFDFTHEVLSKEESEFMGEKIERDRRISVICRDLPKAQDLKPLEFKSL